ncbi:MAG: hypothetical protein U9N73_11850 [Candidatus Auribacterota bacterium]|nr:hypothetical protein [Candidatus Auribacterota bacterium]
MKTFLVIILAVCMLIPLAVQAKEIKVEAQPVEIAEADTAAEEFGEPGAVATAGWPAFTYFWGSYNYEYVVQRRQLIMGLEFATNALPLGFNVYMWMDFSGVQQAVEYAGGSTISDLRDHAGSFNIYWPLNSYDFLPIDWLDAEFEYNVTTFDDDNLYFGPRVRFLDIPALKGVKDALDSLSYPGGASLNCSLYFLRTDGTGDSDNWMKFAIFYKIPFNIAGVDCYTQAWCDIDVSDPIGQNGMSNQQGRGTWSFQNTVGVNVWSHLWLAWELKREKFNYWTSTPFLSSDNLVWDNSIMAQWQVLF